MFSGSSINLIQVALIVLVIVFLLFVVFYTGSGVKVKAESGREWLVADYEDAYRAGKYMDDLNNDTIKLLGYIKKKYKMGLTDDEYNAVEQEKLLNSTAARFRFAGAEDLYNILDAVLTNYNPDVIYENDPRYSSQTAYTLNKGSAMYLCIRDKNTGKFVEYNDMIFVLIHEISHIANYNNIGHEFRFWCIFKLMLENAVEAGVYKPVDYGKNNINYCGLVVDYNPLFDETI